MGTCRLTKEVIPLASLTWVGSMTSRLQILLYHPLLSFLPFVEGDESELVQSNTYNSRVPPVMGNNNVDLTDGLANFEPYMRFLMDGGVDGSIDSLMNLDVPQDVIGNMDL